MQRGLGVKTVQTEIFDKDGNLTKIEVHLLNGEHLFDALWDPRDAQTHDNRADNIVTGKQIGRAHV